METHMIIRHDIGLIGDGIATFPLLIELSEKEDVDVILPHGPVKELFELCKNEHMHSIVEGNADFTLDLGEAFQYHHKDNLYMSQCYHVQVGLPDPVKPLKVDFKTRRRNAWAKEFIILAPFSRSLPEDQKWPQHKWKQLVDLMPDTLFIIVGNTKYDDREYLKAPNVSASFDMPMEDLIDLIHASKGVLSVVTGISHLAFHCNKKNWLFVNQGKWGKNPEAICMDNYIPNISASEVFYFLKNR